MPFAFAAGIAAESRALPCACFGEHGPFPRPGLCAVAKASIMYMPGFGAMTALCGGIMIKRGKKGTMQQVRPPLWTSAFGLVPLD